MVKILNDRLSGEAKRFKVFRKAEKLTQEEMGKLIGKDQTTVMRYEKGEYPIPGEVVKDLVRLKKMSFNWFYFGEGSQRMEKEKRNLLTSVDNINTEKDMLALRVQKLESVVNKLVIDFYESRKKSKITG